MTLCTVNVSTADFRRALSTVRVHASADKDDPSAHRIRLIIDGENVSVVATDRFTLALAIASVWDAPDASPAVVDLLPDDASKICSIFKAGKESGDEPDFRLRLDIDTDHLLVTDCSGLIDGRALRVPRLPTEVEGVLTNAPAMIQRAHDSAGIMLADFAVSGDLLSRFKVAAGAYHEPVVIEAKAAVRALLLRCGESFLGLMMPRSLSDSEVRQQAEWAAAWDRRLPDIAVQASAEK